MDKNKQMKQSAVNTSEQQDINLPDRWYLIIDNSSYDLPEVCTYCGTVRDEFIFDGVGDKGNAFCDYTCMEACYAILPDKEK